MPKQTKPQVLIVPKHNPVSTVVVRYRNKHAHEQLPYFPYILRSRLRTRSYKKISYIFHTENGAGTGYENIPYLVLLYPNTAAVSPTTAVVSPRNVSGCRFGTHVRTPAVELQQQWCMVAFKSTLACTAVLTTGRKNGEYAHNICTGT